MTPSTRGVPWSDTHSNIVNNKHPVYLQEQYMAQRNLMNMPTYHRATQYEPQGQWYPYHYTQPSSCYQQMTQQPYVRETYSHQGPGFSQDLSHNNASEFRNQPVSQNYYGRSGLPMYGNPAQSYPSHIYHEPVHAQTHHEHMPSTLHAYHAPYAEYTAPPSYSMQGAAYDPNLMYNVNAYTSLQTQFQSNPQAQMQLQAQHMTQPDLDTAEVYPEQELQEAVNQLQNAFTDHFSRINPQRLHVSYACIHGLVQVVWSLFFEKADGCFRASLQCVREKETSENRLILQHPSNPSNVANDFGSYSSVGLTYPRVVQSPISGNSPPVHYRDAYFHDSPSLHVNRPKLQMNTQMANGIALHDASYMAQNTMVREPASRVMPSQTAAFYTPESNSSLNPNVLRTPETPEDAIPPKVIHPSLIGMTPSPVSAPFSSIGQSNLEMSTQCAQSHMERCMPNYAYFAQFDADIVRTFSQLDLGIEDICMALYFINYLSTDAYHELMDVGSRYGLSQGQILFNIFVTAGLLANKTLQDSAYRNTVVSQVSGIPCKLLNVMERIFLNDYNHSMLPPQDRWLEWFSQLQLQQPFLRDPRSYT